MDGDIELAVGAIGGELAIYKYNKVNPWKLCDGLGTIACVTVGDLRKHGKNSLVVLSGEGICYLFDIAPDESDKSTKRSSATSFATHPTPSPAPQSGTATTTTGSSTTASTQVQSPPTLTGSGTATTSSTTVSPTMASPANARVSLDQQQPPSITPQGTPNPKARHTDDSGGTNGGGASNSSGKVLPTPSAVLASANGDEPAPPIKSALRSALKTTPLNGSGSVGGSGGTSSSPLVKPKSATTAKKVHFQKIQTKENEWFTEVIEPAFSHGICYNASVAIIADADDRQTSELIVGTSSREILTYSLVKTGPNNDILCLQQKRKFLLSNKVNSLAFSRNDWGRAQLYVGQVSDDLAYLRMDHKENFKTVQIPMKHAATSPMGSRQPSLQQTAQLSGSNGPDEKLKASCPVEVRDFSRSLCKEGTGENSPNLLGLVSLDGHIALVKDDKVLWAIKTNKQLYGLTACDITGNGTEEMVFSSWDGKTYILDREPRCVEFQFEDQFCAFTAGQYSISPGDKSPCVVYGTFFEEIFIYYNISLPVKHAFARKKRGEDLVPEEGTEELGEAGLAAYRDALKRQLDEKRARNAK